MKKLICACLAVLWSLGGGALQPANAALSVQIGQNFTASTYFTDVFSTPPDSDGAIGPNHYVQLINGNFSVWDKTSGVRLQTMSDTAFWNSAGVTFSSGV